MAVGRRRTAWGLVAACLLAAGCGPAAGATSTGGATSAGAVSGTAMPHQSQPTVSATGSPVPPRPGKPLWLQWLQMTSVDDGWAVSQSGSPASPSVSPPWLVTRTADGGQTWADVTPAGARAMLATSGAAEELNAVDGERAYFTVTVSTAIVLFATDDAGQTWTESAPLRTASHGGALTFTDADHGWLLMSEGAAMGNNPVRLYRSTDGGRHWSLTASSPPFGSKSDTGIPSECDKTAITFPAVTAGWLTSECNAASPDALLVSRDGGVTWTPQPLPVPLGTNGNSAVLAGPEFADGTGFLTAGQYGGRPALLVTADLGRTWRQVPLPAGAGSYPQVKFFSPADGVLVPAGTQGTLGAVFYTTSDGGQTWTAIPQGRHFTKTGVTIDFVSPRTGFAWILGGDAQGASPPPMYVTTDSGRTWKSFTPRLERFSS